ncbi:MAG: hypothetical protein ACON4C_00755 [Henriciella sp.]|jgi:hypothetical protein
MSASLQKILSIVTAAFLVMSPVASADPEFEIAPLDMSAIPGSFLHNPMAVLRWEPAGPNKRVSIVESEGVPGDQAISFMVRRKNIAQPWEPRIRAPFEVDISAGDEIDIYFWARASRLARGAETGRIGAVLGRKVPPYDTVMNEQVRPGPEWKMYKVSAVAERDFPASETDMGFDLGFEKQTIELGPYFAVKR